VEERLTEHLPADLLLVNPPRSGLHRDVPGTVLAAPPARVVYVSCDPATLARDVAALGAGYDLRGLRSFDLFPQTAHVETVAVLVRRERGV
jgi:23S rRNA (uracil1939-C5)-methyltransferase